MEYNVSKLRRHYWILDHIVLLIKALDSDACPLLGCTKLSIQELRQFARYNKVSFVLSHMITCTHCKALLSTQEFIDVRNSLHHTKPIQLLLFEHELIVFHRLAETRGIRYVLLKDTRNVPDILSCRYHTLGSDVDILVRDTYFPLLKKIYSNMGYSCVEYKHKEMNVTSPQTMVTVDIHKTIAYPHYGNLLEMDANAVTKINMICLNGQTPFLSKETLLIVQIVRFWSNDFALGLRQILDILEISLRYEEAISWPYVITTLADLGYLSRYIAVLYIGKKIFSYPRLPKAIQSIPISFRIPLLANILDVTDVSYVNDFREWNTTYRRQSYWYHLRYLFITYVFDTRYAITRIIRPRFILIIFYLVLKYIFRSVPALSFRVYKNSNTHT